MLEGNINMKISEALNSTYDMLSDTFSDGISEEYYIS